jgi:hypothetical protein
MTSFAVVSMKYKLPYQLLEVCLQSKAKNEYVEYPSPLKINEKIFELEWESKKGAKVVAT